MDAFSAVASLEAGFRVGKHLSNCLSGYNLTVSQSQILPLRLLSKLYNIFGCRELFLVGTILHCLRVVGGRISVNGTQVSVVVPKCTTTQGSGFSVQEGTKGTEGTQQTICFLNDSPPLPIPRFAPSPTQSSSVPFSTPQGSTRILDNPHSRARAVWHRHSSKRWSRARPVAA